jgi:hypothetical protein
MIDAEVIRLRRLRRAALQMRGLARALLAASAADAALERAAVLAWSIARLMSGRLKAHPNLRYQQGPAWVQNVIDGTLASLTGFVAVKQGRARPVMAEQLQILTRELADARALSGSRELGDALGRAQWRLWRLTQEFTDTHPELQTAVQSGAQEIKPGDAGGAGDWPYLAI